MRLLAIAAAASAMLAAPAAAQIGVEGNLADVDGAFGGELGVTYDIEAAGFTLRPAVGAFLSDDLPPDGGREVCRENVDGEPAASSDCDSSSVEAYGRLELLYELPVLGLVGGGIRVSDDVLPYATLAFTIAPFVKIKGNVGPDYYAGGLTVGF